MSRILSFFVDEVRLWDSNAIIRAIKNTEEMAAEFFPKRKIRRVENFDHPMSVFIEKVLQGEKLGTLTGFGLCTKEKNEDGGTRILRRFFVNPEKQSILGDLG